MSRPSITGIIAAFAWPLWARNRRFYLVGLVALLGLLFFTVAVDDGRHEVGITMFLLGNSRSVIVGGIYYLLAIALAATAVGMPAFGIFGQPSTLSTPYRGDTFALPLSTAALVWIPFLISLGIFSILWGVFLTVAVSLLGLQVPIVLSYLTAVACLGILHAALWIGGWIKWVSGMLPAPFLIILYAMSPTLGTMALDRILGLIVICLALFGLTAWAAPKSRNGHPSPRIAWKLFQPHRSDSVPEPTPFGSPARAQLWYEGGRNYVVVIQSLFFPTLILVTFLFPAIAMRQFGGFEGPHPERWYRSLGFAGIKIEDQVALIFLPYLPALFGGFGPNGMMGRAFRGLENGFEMRLMPLLAVLPTNMSVIVAARLRLAAASALALSPLLLLFVWGLLSTRAYAGGRYDSLANILAWQLGERTPWMLLLVLLCIPLFIWSLQGGNPLPFIRYPALRLIGIFGVLFVSAGTSLTNLSFLQFSPLHLDFRPLMLTVATAWLIGKAVLAIYALRQIRERQLLRAHAVRNYVGIWVGALIALSAAFAAGLAPLGAKVLPVAMIVALALPANRFLWLLINLDTARHSLADPSPQWANWQKNAGWGSR